MNLVQMYYMVKCWCGFEATSISYTFICGENRHSSYSPLTYDRGEHDKGCCSQQNDCNI